MFLEAESKAPTGREVEGSVVGFPFPGFLVLDVVRGL
jgi:hypothetical protein